MAVRTDDSTTSVARLVDLVRQRCPETGKPRNMGRFAAMGTKEAAED